MTSAPAELTQRSSKPASHRKRATLTISRREEFPEAHHHRLSAFAQEEMRDGVLVGLCLFHRSVSAPAESEAGLPAEIERDGEKEDGAPRPRGGRPERFFLAGDGDLEREALRLLPLNRCEPGRRGVPVFTLIESAPGFDEPARIGEGRGRARGLRRCGNLPRRPCDR